MAEGGGGGGSQGVSSFPLPPTQYFSLYTDENVRKGKAPKPPAPIKDAYSMFGVQFRADDEIIRPLEAQGLRRLYPHNYDHKRELKKLNYSILVNFLDLLDVLIKSPDSVKRCEKIDDLTLLFIHMHHLINEFRPHQARETLRVMLDVQKRQRLDTLDRFQLHLAHVQEMIQNSLASLPDDTTLDSKLLITPLTNLPPPLQSPLPTPQGVGEDDEGEGMSEEEEEKVDHETLDKMMCDIVDALN